MFDLRVTVFHGSLMGRLQKRCRARAARAQATGPHKSIDLMDTPPATPQERAEAVNLTISAPATPDVLSDARQQLSPPSPSSLTCATERRASTSPAAAHPILSPAWEGKDGAGQDLPLASDAPATADDPAAIPNRAALASGGTSAALPDSPPSSAAERRDVPSANLRLDLIPPVRQPQPSVLPPAAALEPPPGPSPSAASGNGAHMTPPQRAVRAFFAHSDVAPEEALRSNAASSPMRAVEGPPSSRSAFSGIFELEMESPMAPATGGGVAVVPHSYAIQDSEESVLTASDAVAAPATTSGNNVLSPRSSLPIQGAWGRIASSPDSFQPLQGSWGRLQEVRWTLKALHYSDIYILRSICLLRV